LFAFDVGYEATTSLPPSHCCYRFRSVFRKQADLESGLEKKAVQKPPHISAREFVHWLAPDSHIDDDSLRSLFKL
jgi:hypothetical protein